MVGLEGREGGLRGRGEPEDQCSTVGCGKLKLGLESASNFDFATYHLSELRTVSNLPSLSVIACQRERQHRGCCEQAFLLSLPDTELSPAIHNASTKISWQEQVGPTRRKPELARNEELSHQQTMNELWVSGLLAHRETRSLRCGQMTQDRKPLSETHNAAWTRIFGKTNT